MIPPLTDRISLLELVSARFPNGVGVEIGVAGGHFTKQIVATLETISDMDGKSLSEKVSIFEGSYTNPRYYTA